MIQKHPITPSPELVQKWVAATESNDCIGALPTNFEQRICTAAARWGADQELEACRNWLRHEDVGGCGLTADWLYEARRPKPPSLKEQALQALYRFDDTEGHEGLTPEQIAEDFVLIRRALESLPD